MPGMDEQELYKTQISQTEWLNAIGHADAEAFQVEDNAKRERLKRLNEVTGLPYDRAHGFPAAAVATRSPQFLEFLNDHGDELWAVRLVPSDPALPKLRMRGGTLRETLAWIDQQDFDHALYRADFSGHAPEQIWATTFVVNSGGVYGEIIRGQHNQLTQGFYDGPPPFRFGWDFNTLALEPADPEIAAAVLAMLQHLRVPDATARRQLERDLDAQFTNDYLHGYFEANNSAAFGFRFIDYNRVLGRLYHDFRGQHLAPTAGVLVSGQAGSSGRATGRVRVIDGVQPPAIEPGDILVCRMTTPNYLPHMQQAAAIVTDLGGILSHAAIVARELGKPCVTATGNATQVLKTGMLVEVDADSGVVRSVA